jgi:hypothetical protein
MKDGTDEERMAGERGGLIGMVFFSFTICLLECGYSCHRDLRTAHLRRVAVTIIFCAVLH